MAAVHGHVDADVMALYAESVMNTMPWDYYHRERDKEGIWRYIPKPETRDVIETLDKALKLNGNHLLVRWCVCSIRFCNKICFHFIYLLDFIDFGIFRHSICSFISMKWTH